MPTRLLPIRLALAACPVLAVLGACTYTVKVEPIHLTVDVNIKIDRALDDFFAPPAPAAATPTTPATPAK
jgi:hypothetical protein